MNKKSTATDIAEELKGLIEEEYLHGDRFLSTREIAKRYNVSNLIAQKILTSISAVGLLRNVPRSGYFVNKLALQEKVQKKKNIFFLFSEERPFGYDSMHFEVFRGLERLFSDAGWLLIFKSCPFNISTSAVDALLEGAAGCIISSTLSARQAVRSTVKLNKFPCVTYNFVEKGAHAILPDYYNGAKLAIDYLSHLGHKKIAFLKGDIHRDRAPHLKQGYLDGMEENNTGYSLEWDLHKLNAALDDFLKKKRKRDKELPTALYVPNNLVAMEVMEKLAKRNISIPDDLSVVSFDNRLPFLSPPLTTFAPDNDEFCKEIFDLMISSMDKAQKTSITLKYVPVKLLERSSCRKV